jgi:hypothetical protein
VDNITAEIIETIGPGKIRKTPVRLELAAFAIDMEKVLSANDHKTDWQRMSTHTLFNRIKGEYEELYREYILMNNSLDGVNREGRMREEAIDIANYCMFLHHNTLARC